MPKMGLIKNNSDAIINKNYLIYKNLRKIQLINNKKSELIIYPKNIIKLFTEPFFTYYKKRNIKDNYTPTHQ